MFISPARSQDDAIYRKIAWRIVPFLFVCYVVNFIDRVNIGFAKLQFLHDLHLNDAVFGVAAGMFFIGYVLFELPSNLLLARIGVRKTLLRIMVSWGVITVLLMFVKNAPMLYVLRFLLGAAEAGFFPGIILYLTYWFPDNRRGRITSLFIVAVPLAGIIGGPVSGAIMGHLHDALGLRGWQWLFIAEGVPAILL
ncbi:MAG: MFS transporter, partial [Burkholderiales bacterium]|nr:MFS transporter [Burkholderiales bacterium]